MSRMRGVAAAGAAVLFTQLVLAALSAGADAWPARGTAQGAIIGTVDDRGAVFSIRMRVSSKVHEFLLEGAEVRGGSRSDLIEGTSVRVVFTNREHSEMDDFFTARAVTVTILKRAAGKPPL